MLLNQFHLSFSIECTRTVIWECILSNINFQKMQLDVGNEPTLLLQWSFAFSSLWFFYIKHGTGAVGHSGSHLVPILSEIWIIISQLFSSPDRQTESDAYEHRASCTRGLKNQECLASGSWQYIVACHRATGSHNWGTAAWCMEACRSYNYLTFFSTLRRNTTPGVNMPRIKT